MGSATSCLLFVEWIDAIAIESLQEAESALEAYVAENGQVIFASPAHIVTTKRT